MGRRGPPPKPTALKLLEGTARADRAAPAEPEPPKALLEPPEWLPEDARAEWDRVAPELETLNLSTRVDHAMLVAYVMAYDRALAAEERVAEEGLTTYGGSGGMKTHPAVTIAASSWDAVRRFAAEFGLTPASRTRISVPPKAPEKPASLKDRLRGNARGA